MILKRHNALFLNLSNPQVMGYCCPPASVIIAIGSTWREGIRSVVDSISAPLYYVKVFFALEWYFFDMCNISNGYKI